MNEDTIALVSNALDAAVMRQTAITSNIAHLNTQGYQPLAVAFEAQLQDCLTLHEKAQHTATYVLSSEPNAIDTQLAQNLQNTTQYRALIKGLNEHLALYKIALSGNNAS